MGGALSNIRQACARRFRKAPPIEVQQMVDAYIAGDTLVLFGKKYCQHTQAAISILEDDCGLRDDAGHPQFTKVWLMDKEANSCVATGTVDDWQQHLGTRSDGATTVPRVFLKGEFFADRSALEDMLDDGTLHQHLKMAGLSVTKPNREGLNFL